MGNMSGFHRSVERVWIDNTHPMHASGVTSWNPDTDEVTALAHTPALAHLADHTLYGVSGDGETLALGVNTVFRGANKVDLVVVRRDGTELLRTRDYLVYDVVFSHDARVLLLESFNNKPRRYVFSDATGQYEDAGTLAKSFRQFAGGLDPQSDRFIAAAESRFKGRVIVADLALGEVEEVRLPLDVVQSVTFIAGGDGLIVRFEASGVARLSRDWQMIWQVDATNWHGAPPVDQPELGVLKLSGSVYETGDGSLLCVEVPGATTTNDWGTEYVLDPATGEVVRYVEAYQGRGRAQIAVGDQSLLLFNGHTLDLSTGQVSDAVVTLFEGAEEPPPLDLEALLGE